jgi:hypothetical protein
MFVVCSCRHEFIICLGVYAVNRDVNKFPISANILLDADNVFVG